MDCTRGFETPFWRMRRCSLRRDEVFLADLVSAADAVPWSDIVAFRSIAIHRYFGIGGHIVWNTATSDVPALRQDALKIIDAFGDGDSQ
jgi:uncharacterized protein with HEPN domain